MEWLGELWRRLLFPFRRRQFDRDLEEEMRFHLEMKARDSGASAARRQFGNATLLHERSREMWAWRWIERAGRELPRSSLPRARGRFAPAWRAEIGRASCRERV